jgi:hypothetical protein
VPRHGEKEYIDSGVIILGEYFRTKLAVRDPGVVRWTDFFYLFDGHVETVTYPCHVSDSHWIACAIKPKTKQASPL